MFGCQAQPQPMPPETPTPSISLPKQTASPQPIESPYLNPKVEIVAGTGEQGFQDGPAMQAMFNQLSGICHDLRNGDLFILDRHRIRKLDQTGQITTLAGSSEAGYQDGAGTSARFHFLSRCTVDANGQVYVSDARNHRIRLITPAGEVTTLLGTGEPVLKDGSTSEASTRLPQSLAVRDQGDLPPKKWTPKKREIT